jgi:hypothetical protein
MFILSGRFIRNQIIHTASYREDRANEWKFLIKLKKCFQVFKFIPLIFIATPIFADSEYKWGIGDFSLYPQSSITLEESVECTAQIIIDNQLSKSSPQDMRIDLDLNGVSVVVLALQESNEIPDKFAVLPPKGYYAEPEEILLEENTQGIIQICSEVGS